MIYPIDQPVSFLYHFGIRIVKYYFKNIISKYVCHRSIDIPRADRVY